MKLGKHYGMHTHGHCSDRRASPTYVSWTGLRNRCLNKSNSCYATYGAIGITVCDRWKQSFENFLEDMGERPPNTTMDRIDNSKGYFKENCRWASPKEQAINRNNTRFYTIDGVTKCLKEWTEQYNITYLVVFKRLKRGWKIMRSLTTIPQKRS